MSTLLFALVLSKRSVLLTNYFHENKIFFFTKINIFLHDNKYFFFMIINNYFHENNYRVSGLQREKEY